MDALSDVLGAVRVTGAVFFTARVAPPWAIESPPPEELPRTLRVRSDRMALFHLVVRGRCWVTVEGAAPVMLDGGAIVILPRGNVHRVMSDVGVPPVPLSHVLSACRGDEIPHIESGPSASPDGTQLVCGFLQCDQRFNPLIGALPRLIVAHPFRHRLVTVPGLDGRPIWTSELGADDDDWLARTFRHMSEEANAGRPGRRVMLSRLAEVLYMEVVRSCFGVAARRRSGWFAAARDPEVGRALGLMHAQPERKWTVTTLARSSGLSRSAFSGRFHALVGAPPMHYLSSWRMQRAIQLLRDPRLSIAQVASRVGYDSPVAFHRAFRRSVGETPAAWRRGRAFDATRASASVAD
jgi:AraC-like DNA-binding protein